MKVYIKLLRILFQCGAIKGTVVKQGFLQKKVLHETIIKLL